MKKQESLIDRMRHAAHIRDVMYVADYNAQLLREGADEIEKLRSAIRLTLDENGHLADGDNCTLNALKRALGDE